MKSKKIVIQKISQITSAYDAVKSKLESFKKFKAMLTPEGKEKIRTENITNCIYLYLFYDPTSSKDSIKEIAICVLSKEEEQYNLVCEYILDNHYKIQYLLGVNDISPTRDFAHKEYTDLEDDIGLYNRANDFIYYRYYHENIDVGTDRLYGNKIFVTDTSAILASKSFRRLENKAQIYSSLKGDHYRNRLTHTLDVANISTLISKGIDENNNDLISTVEAISFGHDIGHTPFGHVGERTLENIIKGKTKIINNAGEMLYKDIGGFKHNIQSVRILAKLESASKMYRGLNISYEILEGILKHSNYDPEDVKKMIPDEYLDKLHLESKDNRYLSGQIVYLADEIAQRCADIEDAIRSGKISIEDVIKIIDRNDYLNIKVKYEQSIEKDIPVVDEIGIKICVLQNIIKEYFITQLVDEYKQGEKLEFNEKTKRLNDAIKKLIDHKVLYSNEVSNFDNKGKIIIEKLFKLYYDNPRLLNDNTIRNIFIDMMDNVICWSNTPIDFRNMSPEFIDNEIKAIHSIGSEYASSLEGKALIAECGGLEYIYEAQKIIVRNICDYIAGMTDEFAQSEYMEKVLALSIN